MTKRQRQKRATNLRYHAKKREQGWQFLTICAPPELMDVIKATKRQLMAEYKMKKNEAPDPSTVQESVCA